MLDPSPLPESLIPSSFLPPLPRARTSFTPLPPYLLLGHIAILRQLYLPPIHGGFSVADVTSVLGSTEDVQYKRERRFSAGLAETLGGVGLGLNIGADRLAVDGTIQEEVGAEGDQDQDGEEDGEPESGSASDDEGDLPTEHLDPFEREWTQRWLENVVRRAQGIIEEREAEETPDMPQSKEVETVLRDATAVLAMMAGTSAAGSLTRHLLFPVAPSLAPHVRSVQNQHVNPAHSPETHNFLASLSTSPISPIALRHLSLSPTRSTRRRLSTAASQLSVSPDASIGRGPLSPRGRGRRRRRAALPVLLHDAPMGDHLSVGVQTWGSAILLGREMALRPQDFGLFPTRQPGGRGVRVLELGAGTGLLSILCRKLLDLKSAAEPGAEEGTQGLVVATDFLPSVLDNLKVCVDLNFPAIPLQPTPASSSTTNGAEIMGLSKNTGIHIAKLDWSTFPAYMDRHMSGNVKRSGHDDDGMGHFLDEPFDLVLASDCVYDPTHAAMLRQVAGWVLRLPDPKDSGDSGGTFHILSPLRPTFAPELQSIDEHFPPLSTYSSLSDRDEGEGLGRKLRLRLGARGEGKKGVKGRKGEGRVDEVQGYWWWEVGWG